MARWFYIYPPLSVGSTLTRGKTLLGEGVMNTSRNVTFLPARQRACLATCFLRRAGRQKTYARRLADVLVLARLASGRAGRAASTRV